MMKIRDIDEIHKKVKKKNSSFFSTFSLCYSQKTREVAKYSSRGTHTKEALINKSNMQKEENIEFLID